MPLNPPRIHPRHLISVDRHHRDPYRHRHIFAHPPQPSRRPRHRSSARPRPHPVALLRQRVQANLTLSQGQNNATTTALEWMTILPPRISPRSAAANRSCHPHYISRIRLFLPTSDVSALKNFSRLACEFFGLLQYKILLNNPDCARGEPAPLTRKCRLSFVDLTSFLMGCQWLRDNVTSGLADNHEAINFYRPVGNPDRWASVPESREKVRGLDKQKDEDTWSPSQSHACISLPRSRWFVMLFLKRTQDGYGP